MNQLQSLHRELESLRGTALVERLFAFLDTAGRTYYYEEVTQLVHGLQSAQLARAQGLEPTMVTAALLHDIGHLLVDEHDGESDFLAEDEEHETIGADFLAVFFPDEVCDPIRLHVPAKRYLCTVENAYLEGLSEASKRSFALQGGPLSAQEKAAMQALPHLERALTLRRIDDRAKQPGLDTLPLESFLPEVCDSLREAFAEQGC